MVAGAEHVDIASGVEGDVAAGDGGRGGGEEGVAVEVEEPGADVDDVEGVVAAEDGEELAVIGEVGGDGVDEDVLESEVAFERPP